MAQLSDDCFAFGGPMRRSTRRCTDCVAAQPPSRTRKRASGDCRRAHPGKRPGGAPAAAAIHQLGRRRLCPARRRHAGTVEKGFPGRWSHSGGEAPYQPASPDKPCASSLALRCRRRGHGFMQEDVACRRCRPCRPAARPEAGRQCAPDGRGRRSGQVVLRPAIACDRRTSRLRPRWASRMSMCGGVSALLSCRPATRSSRRARPRGPAQLFDSNRFMLIAMLARLGCEVDDLGILPDDSEPDRECWRGRRRAAI